MRLAAFLVSFVAFSASAETLAVAPGRDGSSIILTDEVGPCVDGARLAVWISPDAKSRIPGCYRVFAQGVAVSFFDGDRGDIPMQALKKPTSM